MLAVAVLVVLAVAAVLVGFAASSTSHDAVSLQTKLERGDVHLNGQGTAVTSGDESAELMAQQQQFNDERTAPTGVIDPEGYSRGYGALRSLGSTGGTWTELTAKKYDADDPSYRDYYSNSSGGAGLVTGRITGIAADQSGDVYAAGANGGVWRSTTGGGNWTPIADQLPSLSTGTLQLATDGSLWYATGEANTGSTAYVGDGVYRLAHPTSGTFSVNDKVGGDELDGTTIGALRFTATRVWAATSHGLYWHSLSGSMSAPWTLSFAPNPSALTSTDPGSYTANIVNDVAVDPQDENHVIAAAAWRSGASYDGFYETHNATAASPTWTKVNPTGAIPATDIGYVTFAYSKTGDKLYAINQSPTLLNKGTGTVNSYLDGIYVSNNGDPAGPWSKIADSQKLANSGSALKQSIGGKGYGPGIQAWYNQFLIVDPNNSSHVYAGLEEVYETKDSGANWSTVGPYWNFYFPCWNTSVVYDPDQGTPGTNTSCPQTTHSDQHSVAIGTDRSGRQWIYVGNDGGIYRRPLNGSQNADGHATDWQSLNDGTIDALQYYSVSAGPATQADVTSGDAPAGTQVGAPLVSGGMQDNGGSILSPTSLKMSSNFGGDGGDSMVDPTDGCNIVQEYVDLSMYVTNDCAHSTDPQQFVDPTKATTWSIAPPDVNARFIAPFTQDTANSNDWLAGGASLWFQNQGYAIRHSSQWTKIHSWANAGQVTTAVSLSHGVALAAWCGPCNTGGFTRGAAVATLDANGNGTWTDIDLNASGVPNRYISGVAVDPANPQHMVLVASGFSRRFALGPGSGDNHVFESNDGGTTWHSIDAQSGGSFPDIPTNSIVFTPHGGIAVGTDLGVVYLAKGGNAWQRIGTNLPTTVAMQLKVQGSTLYVGTHGRGQWSIDASGL